MHSSVDGRLPAASWVGAGLLALGLGAGLVGSVHGAAFALFAIGTLDEEAQQREPAIALSDL